jgi:hypothetical protein
LPRARRVHLHNVGQILQELGRQYRRADVGQLPWCDALAAARILKEMRATLEGSALEARLEVLEKALDIPRPAGANGHVPAGVRPWAR